MALAMGLILSVFAGASAQVATLRTPDPDAEASAAPQDQAELSGQETILAFAACMRENGVDMDDPQFGVGGALFGGGDGDGPGFDPQSPTFQAAFESCGSLLAALQPDLDPAQQAEQAERQLALAECMRGHDIDFPDPDPDGGFGFRAGAGGLDFQDPDFQDAFQACQQELGGFGFGPGGGGPGGNGGVAD
jgi:hypothetical protein